jgi:hypothetical protein
MAQPWPSTGAEKVQVPSLELPTIRSTTPGSRLHWITGALAGMRNFETTQARASTGSKATSAIDFAKIIDSKRVVYVPVQRK